MGIGKCLWRAWEWLSHFDTARSLTLTAIGGWSTVVGLLTGIWSWVEGLSAPAVFVLGLGAAVLFFLLLWVVQHWTRGPGFSLFAGEEKRDVSLFDAIAYKAFRVWPHEKDIEISASQLKDMFEAKNTLLQAAADGPDKLKIWGKPANRFEGVLELIEPDYWKQYSIDGWEIVKVAYGKGKRECMKTQAPEFSRRAWLLYDNLMTSKAMVKRLK